MMFKRSIRTWTLTAVAATVALVSGCASSATPETTGSSSGVLVIGTTLPLSGPLADLGGKARQAYELAVADINAEGGVNGTTLELIVEDDQGDPAQSAQLTRDLIENEGVQVMLGSFGSEPSKTLAAQAEALQVPHILPFASDPAVLATGNKYLLNLFTPVDLAEDSIDKFLVDEIEPESVALLVQDAAFTNAAGAASRENLEEAGIPVTVDEPFAAATEDFSTLVLKAKDADVIKIFANQAQYVSIMQALAQQNINPEVVYGNLQTPFEAAVIDGLGAVADYVLGMPLGGDAEYKQRFIDEFGRTPGNESYIAYAAVEIVADAYARAGTADHDALMDALRSTDLETVDGVYNFDDRGQAIVQPDVAQVQDGQEVVVWTVDDGANGKFLDWVPFGDR